MSPLAVAGRFCENSFGYPNFKFLYINGSWDCPNFYFVKIEWYWDYEKLSLEISSPWVDAHRMRVLGGDLAQYGFLILGVFVVLSGRRGAYY